LQTADRLLAEAGFELTAVPRVEFVDHTTARGRIVPVPTHLPRLPVEQALATVTLPLHGVLLIELWDDLVLPRDIRTAWAPLIEQALHTAA
jgi:hypothetical protein